MKTEQIKVTRNFLDGDLVEKGPEYETHDLIFPENAKVMRLSISREQPLQVYAYGNAKTSIHVSIPCLMEETEIENAMEYLTNFANSQMREQSLQYLEALESRGIDWEKVDKQMKAGK